MSSTLANKIRQIKAQQENPEETFDRTQFLQRKPFPPFPHNPTLLSLVLKELEPEYVLTDEEIHGIFDFTDNAKVKFPLEFADF